MAQPIGKRAYTKAFQNDIDFPYFLGKLDRIIDDPITFEEQIQTDNYHNDENHLTVCHGAWAMEWLGTYQAIVKSMLPERLSYDTLERLGQDTEQEQWATETLEECLEDAARRVGCFISYEDGEVFICKDIETRSTVPLYTNTTSPFRT
jgi:hypothetical protein